MLMIRNRRAAAGGALAAALVTAAVVPLAAAGSAVAAADVQITAVDCKSHPRRIAIFNGGDAPQALAGWRLESDQPDETFDLRPVVSVAAGETFFVFNGHGAPDAPEQSGGSWIYPWNPGSFDFALWEDGQDFIRIVDSAGNEVSRKACPIPPATPTPPPEQPQPTQQPSEGAAPGDSGSNTNTTATGDSGASQTQGGSQGSGSSARSAGQSGTTTTTAEVLGPHAPGEEAPLPSGGGSPASQGSLTVALLAVLTGPALVLWGVSLMRLALSRAGRDH